MTRRTGRNGGRGNNPGQLQFEWRAVAGKHPITVTPPPTISRSETNASVDHPAVQPLVQRLPWDFETTFPEPLPKAIEAGILEDDEIDTVRWIHLEHAKEALAVLHELDAVLDARRRGVNPETGKPPRTPATAERLRKFFETEPGRLEQWFNTLLDTYEEAFGADATDAFRKALRARHAGIPVTTERPESLKSHSDTSGDGIPLPHAQKLHRRENPRVIARLPVPSPLPSAVAAGHFGHEESGKPVRPGNHEVREITRRHAEKLIELLDSISAAPLDKQDTLLEIFQFGIADYAKDFGNHAAQQLEAFVRRQASLGVS